MDPKTRRRAREAESKAAPMGCWWTKQDGEWLVAGDPAGLASASKYGTSVKVTSRDGETKSVRIKSLLPKQYARNGRLYSIGVPVKDELEFSMDKQNDYAPEWD